MSVARVLVELLFFFLYNNSHRYKLWPDERPGVADFCVLIHYSADSSTKMLLSDLKGRLTLGSLVVSAVLTSVVTAAECSREALLATAEKYVAAQNSGKLDDLQKLFVAANFIYQENNKIMEIQKGVISTALKVEYSRSTADTVACASYTELVALTPTPHVIGTQIRHSLGVDTITMVDSIVATTGALFFNATASLGYFQKVN
jgi:hypothetical protein